MFVSVALDVRFVTGPLSNRQSWLESHMILAKFDWLETMMPSMTVPDPFVGRERELKTLSDWVKDLKFCDRVAFTFIGDAVFIRVKTRTVSYIARVGCAV